LSSTIAKVNSKHGNHSKRIGSIEKGKDADLVLFNGDPFEYLTKPCLVIIDGKVEADNQCK